MVERWRRARIEVGERMAGLGEFTAHAETFEEVDGFGECGVGGGEIAAQGVEAGKMVLCPKTPRSAFAKLYAVTT